MRYFKRASLPILIQWLCVIVVIMAIATTTLAQSSLSFQYFYDSLNRVVRVIDSRGNVITYTYDEVGNLVSVTRTTVAILPPPMLTSATPNQVNRDDPATVMLMGAGLLGGTVTTTHPGITIIGTALIDDTKISVSLIVASTAQLGQAPLTVTTIRGSASINITVVGPRPRITAISPSQGPSTGGTPVTITGSNFNASTTVTIGGSPATNVVLVNNSTLTAVTPAGPATQPPTSVDVVVKNPFGLATLTNGFRYIFGLKCGDLVSGSISTARETDLFAFNGQMGMVVDIVLVVTGGFDSFRSILPRVTLFAPSGAQLSVFDANAQRSFTLAENGVYVIQVNANDLVSTGSYNLGLECRQPLGPVDGTLNCGSLLSGTISASGEVDLITFSGQTGQVVDLTLVLTAGFDSFRSVLPRVTLFSPTGAQLDSFDANVQKTYTLPESGTYLIRVNANNLFHTGSYNLGLECRRPLGPVDGTLSCGSLLSGTIEAPGEVDLITFSGQTGDVVDLTLVLTAGFDSFRSVLPRVTLFSPTGAQLDSFDANVQKTYTLPESGTYLIRVNANNLVATGSYNLRLQCSP